MLIYSGALLMLAGTGLSISTWDFTTPFLCRVAIFLCLSFYIGNKSLVYLYLVERIHELRNKRRTKDYVWYIGILIVVGGFTTVATFAYMNVVDAASNVNNRCRIGLHNLETLLLLGYDVTINVSLTVVFTAQSWQWFRYLPLKSQLATLVSSIPNALRKEKLLATSLQEYKAEVLKVIISKSLFGAVAIMLPTVANQVVLYKLNGHEQAWLCFTACTLDVTWSTIVVHWMTNDPSVGLNDAPAGRRGSTHLPAGSSPYYELDEF